MIFPDFQLELPFGIDIMLIGLIITLLGGFFYFLLFSPERIKGYQAEYEAAPDLREFRVVKTYSTEKTIQKGPIPEFAYCSACGKQIFRPFSCAKCHQLLCGEHYLQGTHNCTE